MVDWGVGLLPGLLPKQDMMMSSWFRKTDWPWLGSVNNVFCLRLSL